MKTVLWRSAGQGVRKCPRLAFRGVAAPQACVSPRGPRTSCEVGMEPAIGRDIPWGRLILLFYEVGVKMCPVRLVVHGFASEIHMNIFFFCFLSHWVGLKKYVSHGILGSGFS